MILVAERNGKPIRQITVMTKRERRRVSRFVGALGGMKEHLLRHVVDRKDQERMITRVSDHMYAVLP